LPYPKNIDHKLEFNQIKSLVLNNCLSEMGKQYVDKINFVNKQEVLTKLLLQTKEFQTILNEDNHFPIDHYFDIRSALHKAKIEGVWLDEEEFLQIKLVLQTFLLVSRFLRDKGGKYPQLEMLLEGLIFNDILIRRIDRVIDTEGLMRPNASVDLSKLSQKIQEKETEIRKRINRLFDKNYTAGYLTDNIGITIREGRLVLPVLAEHKRHVPGFTHDESQTGQTVFIEPTECFELNNLLRELQIAYRREKERILLDLTDQLRPQILEITAHVQRLGLFDFIRAKALLANAMKAGLPILSKHPVIELYNAYHPLLKLNHDKLGLQTVPLNIQLNNEKHIVVISGPNAGGKSVCLKTIGLLQYMLQCGFLVPCADHSVFGVFKEMMVDIGDEQSIENDLSTYSSHLLHMKKFCDFADAKTLFLIDEFGTGTDPQFGGPLAESILNYLAQKRSFGVVTTHFSNLKNFAATHKGLENASMLFDHENMQPLYRLELGRPGSSYAFELATKSGLPEHIINYAKNKVGVKQKKVDDLLLELEKEQKQVALLKEKLLEKEKSAAASLEKYQALASTIEEHKKTLMKQAKQEALAIVTEANSKVEAVIRDIKKGQADIESQRKARLEIKQDIVELKEELAVEAEEELQAPVQVDGKIEIGSFVQMIDQDTVGEVLELSKNKAIVNFGNLKTTVDLKKLKKVAKPSIKKVVNSAAKGIDLNEKMMQFKPELNLIATRADEAIKVLERYLDDAYLLGIKEVKIVHGKGYGILRKVIREFLNNSKLVVKVKDEHIDFGGDGISVVTLNTQ